MIFSEIEENQAVGNNFSHILRKCASMHICVHVCTCMHMLVRGRQRSVLEPKVLVLPSLRYQLDVYAEMSKRPLDICNLSSEK